MSVEVTFKLEMSIPQLNNFKEILMDALEPVRDALVRQGEVITTELAEIAEALRQGATDPAAVATLAGEIDAMSERIRGMVTLPPVEPTP